jgi:hypothetical protein
VSALARPTINLTLEYLPDGKHLVSFVVDVDPYTTLGEAYFPQKVSKDGLSRVFR